MVGPLARRPRAGRHRRLRDVRAGLRLERGDRGRDRLHHPAGDGAATAIPMRFGAGVITVAGLARHPHAAVDPEGDLRDRDQHLDRRALRRGPAARASCSPRCSARSPGTSRGSATTRAWSARRLARALAAFRDSIWGLMLVVIIIGGIYSGIFTATEAAAMAAIYSFFVAIFVYKDLKMKDVPKVLLDSANMSRDAALHHHQRGALLLHPHQREHPERARRLVPRQGARRRRIPAGREHPCCSSPATSWSPRRHPDHGADPVPDGDDAWASTRCTWASSST